MRSIEQAIGFRDENDLNVLNEYMRRELRTKPENVDALLRALLDNMLHDKKWIREAKAALASETAHVAAIGQTMKRAGLRSYTDEKGRIFVAGDP